MVSTDSFVPNTLPFLFGIRLSHLELEVFIFAVVQRDGVGGWPVENVVLVLIFMRVVDTGNSTLSRLGDMCGGPIKDTKEKSMFRCMEECRSAKTRDHMKLRNTTPYW